MPAAALDKRADDAPFDRDPERSYTIPARYYLDSEILEQEKQAVFYRNWWYAGHQSQLREPGSYLTVQVCDQNIIVIRDRLLAFPPTGTVVVRIPVAASGTDAAVNLLDQCFANQRMIVFLFLGGHNNRRLV